MHDTDDELVALCGKLVSAQLELEEICERDYDGSGAALELVRALVAMVAAIRPTTLEGFRAKAAAAIAVARAHDVELSEYDIDSKVVWSLARDLAAGRTVLVP